MTQAPMLDAGRVLRDLDELWSGIGKQEGAGVLRACAMTLVVVSPEDDDPQVAGEILAGLMKEHPSRVVLVRLRHDVAAPSSRATVQCWMPFGRRQQICSEQIDIDAPAGRLEEVLPVLRGVLVADLPVVLWCRSLSLAVGEEVRALLPLADRVIVDTAGSKEARDALPLLETLRGGRAQVADLAWTRLTHWRETMQRVFRTPSCLGRLQQTTGIGVRWAGEGLPATACYLASWLLSLAPDARLTLACVDRRLPAKGMGRIREVSLRGPELDLRLRRPEGTGVAIEIDALATKVLFPMLDTASLLREELGVFGRDTRFEAALRLAPEVARMPVEMP